MTEGPNDDERRQLATVRTELIREFADQLSADRVQQLFEASVGRFDGAPIRSFVPMLAGRSARLELRHALAGA